MSEIKNLRGSLDLLKMQKTCIVEIKGVKCLLAPIEANDIFVTKDEQTGKAKGAYLNVNINERREKSQYGKTHYAKQGWSKGYLEKLGDSERKALNDIYFGDFEPYEFDSGNQAASVSAPSMDVPQDSYGDDLPF